MDNKTKKYLAQSLYLTDIHEVLSKLKILGFYIGHKSFIDYTNHIFLLCKTTPKLNKELSNIRLSNYYTLDYKAGNDHMIVIKIPEELNGIMKKFLASKYSKMYSNKLIKKLFGYNSLLHIYDVLTKNPEVKEALEYRIGEKLSEAAELDDAIKLEEEIYQYEKEIEYNRLQYV